MGEDILGGGLGYVCWCGLLWFLGGTEEILILIDEAEDVGCEKGCYHDAQDVVDFKVMGRQGSRALPAAMGGTPECLKLELGTRGKPLWDTTGH